MSEAAAQFRRIRDALAVGNVLAPGDAAALHTAFVRAEANGISIEQGLKWSARWRDEVRIADVLIKLSELRTGLTDRESARRIQKSPLAMKQLAAANRGKQPSDRVLRGWLSRLGQNYGPAICPGSMSLCGHEQIKADSKQPVAASDRR
jgi:hypothetical protein